MNGLKWQKRILEVLKYYSNMAPDHEIVCFHCQQAIEKYLKGYLIYLTGELQEGHNLVKLCKKVMIYQNDFGRLIKDMAFVNTFYIETRYPALDPLIVSIDDTEDCLKIVDKVVQEINRLINFGDKEGV